MSGKVRGSGRQSYGIIRPLECEHMRVQKMQFNGPVLLKNKIGLTSWSPCLGESKEANIMNIELVLMMLDRSHGPQ